MWNRNILPATALFTAIVSAGLAAENIDLSRATPVPADQTIPTQDFFRPLNLSQPVLNRAGTHIAAIVSAGEDKHMLMVYDIATAKVETLGSRKEQDIYNVNWLTNSRLLFQISSRKMYGLGMMASDVGRLSKMSALQQYSGSSLVSVPLKTPDHPLVWNRYDIETGRDAGVVVLDSNVETEGLADLTNAATNSQSGTVSWVRTQNDRCIITSYPRPADPEITWRYQTDKEGLLAYAFTSRNGDLSLFRLDGKEWKRCPVDLEAIDVFGEANEPGQLLVRGPALDGKPQPLQLMDAATGKLGDAVIQDPMYDFNGWIYRNPATGEALGAHFDKSGPRMVWFNEQYRTLQKVLDEMFPKQIVQIDGSDDTHKIFLVATSSDRQPTVYHWVNLETRKAGLFSNSAPWIDPQRMRPMQIMPFKTRDGYKLDAYLTLPAGATKEHPAPLVVLCHGGPAARDDWGFNGETQFLAHHGYAVLQTNYRGSTGSVGRFPYNDQYDYVKMHNDVTDAVRTALHADVIDKGRVAIMGGSFGGYLAVSGVAHEPDLYRCAVSNAGLFDVAMQLQAEKFDRYDRPFYGRMIKVLGDPKKDAAKYDAMSPINYVQNIRVPVFVAGGKDDEVVQINQSYKLINALERSKVPFEKYIVGGEGHGMAYLKNEVELYDRILAFLDKNMAAVH